MGGRGSARTPLESLALPQTHSSWEGVAVSSPGTSPPLSAFGKCKCQQRIVAITPLMRSMCRVGLLFKKKRIQCTTNKVNLHVRVTQVVSEQVPRRWSSDSEGATAVRNELKPWNNEKMATGGTKMLSFSNLSDRCTQLRQIIRCPNMQALVHRHRKLVCDSICHIESM